MADMYTEDATYGWNVGPNDEFMAVGRDEIRELALGLEMDGLGGWTYPYQRVLIDDVQGEILGLWKQVADATRPDGSHYEIAGLGGSWFRYAGDFKWSWQRDFFDVGNATATFIEMIDAGRPDPGDAKADRAGHVRRAPARPLPGGRGTGRSVGSLTRIPRGRLRHRREQAGRGRCCAGWRWMAVGKDPPSAQDMGQASGVTGTGKGQTESALDDLGGVPGMDGPAARIRALVVEAEERGRADAFGPGHAGRGCSPSMTRCATYPRRWTWCSISCS